MKWIMAIMALLLASSVLAIDYFRFSGKMETDSDGDGVLDSLDLCPDTYPEMDVDSDGCSAAQFCALNVDTSFKQAYPKKVLREIPTLNCPTADWKSNEVGKPFDCKPVKSIDYDGYFMCRVEGTDWSECYGEHTTDYCIERGAD